jgi:hypothetical protein
MTESTPQAPPLAHRRSNFILRALIDEMLEQVRELDRHSAEMASEERVRAEQALDELMARVRRAAMKGPAA